MSLSALTVQKRTVGFLEPELQTVVNCLIWVPGAKPRSSRRATGIREKWTFVASAAFCNGC